MTLGAVSVKLEAWIVPPGKIVGPAICVHVKDKLSPLGSEDSVPAIVNCPPCVTVDASELATAVGAVLAVGVGVGVTVPVDAGGVTVAVEELPPPPPQAARTDAPKTQDRERRDTKVIKNSPIEPYQNLICV